MSSTTVAEVPEQVIDKEPVKSEPKVRLQALDAFRGLTIALMLLVNNIEVEVIRHPQLGHAEWGQMITFCDMVFPWFLFCMGVATPFAIASFKKSGKHWVLFALRMLQRVLLLAALGVIITMSENKMVYTGQGILEVIAMAYLVATVFYILPTPWRALFTVALIIGYQWCYLYYPIPGVGAGVLAEDHNFMQFMISSLSQGAREGRTIPFGGFALMLPAGMLALLGTLVGDILFKRKSEKNYWLTTGLLLLVGLALVAISSYLSQSVPYSKILFSPAYITLAAGTGTIALAIFSLILDGFRWRWWAYPLIVFGSNAIVAYFLPIFTKVWILEGSSFTNLFGRYSWSGFKLNFGDGYLVSVKDYVLNSLCMGRGVYWGAWSYSIAFIFCWWIILWVLHKNKLYLRV